MAVILEGGVSCSPDEIDVREVEHDGRGNADPDKRDYESALKEVKRLWGAKAETSEGDRLDVLATLVDAYEVEHYPMDPPDPVEAIKFRMEHR
jgi:antitoxin component HigA of HigAB toxin-antitoxin module